jgi:prepilin signal peptidase PulO-like enzyme (type II secretory pathway)
MLMIIAILIVLGLALGSFVNALVWRVHEQSKKGASKNKDLSILHGRSMCPFCKHQLSAKDLLPVLSWVSLGGRCRYCKKSVSAQYPLVELATAGLFAASYVWWPVNLLGVQWVVFGLWLVMLTGLMALLVYDFKWQLLPNRIMYPLCYVAGAMAILGVATAFSPTDAFVQLVLAVVVGGGIFYGLFQVSKGKWIGGGDVKLGWLLGAVVATPAKSLLFIFLAAVLGTLFSLPLLSTNRLKRNSTIPFGPFLIIGAIIAYLFGNTIIRWYQHTFLMV